MSSGRPAFASCSATRVSFRPFKIKNVVITVQRHIYSGSIARDRNHLVIFAFSLEILKQYIRKKMLLKIKVGISENVSSR